MPSTTSYQSVGVRSAEAQGLPPLASGSCSGQPLGHMLLPHWQELVTAMPRLGEVCVASRNAHAVIGGVCHYPAEQDYGAGTQFHPDFTAWKEGWHYEERVNGEMLTGFELRDEHGIGFHKIILTAKSDRQFAATLAHALEAQPLDENTISEAVKANHLDGACCEKCEARNRERTQMQRTLIQEFFQRVIARQLPVRCVIIHPGLVTVRRFLPASEKALGNWHSLSDGSTSLFVRCCNLGSLSVDPVFISDIGHCTLAMLRDHNGDLVASLMAEEESAN